jgi:hypothetical protein
MSIDYLAEHADAARIALELAERKAKHLLYTYNTRYQEHIDRAWVQRLAQREDLAEKIDAFVGRFGRLQDHIGEKLLPAFARLLSGQPKSLIDVMAYSERLGWVADAEEFIGTRKLRNLLVHEYMTRATPTPSSAGNHHDAAGVGQRNGTGRLQRGEAGRVGEDGWFYCVRSPRIMPNIYEKFVLHKTIDADSITMRLK